MSFVDTHDFSVDLVLRVLGIPASTYYDWRARQAAPSRRAGEDAELLALIDEIRGSHEFAATYGSPRVWRELRRAASGSAASASSGSCGSTAAAEPTCARVEARVDPAEPAPHRGA